MYSGLHICTTKTTATGTLVKGGSGCKKPFTACEMQCTLATQICCISPPFILDKLLLNCGSLQSEFGTYGSRYTHSYSGRTSHIHTISFCYSLMSVYYMKWFGREFSRAEIHYCGKTEKVAQASAFLGGGRLIPYSVYIHWHAWQMENDIHQEKRKRLICLFLCAQHRTRVACGRCE